MLSLKKGEGFLSKLLKDKGSNKDMSLEPTNPEPPTINFFCLFFIIIFFKRIPKPITR